MDSIDEILNPTGAEKEEEMDDSANEAVGEEATGEITQVAAEESKTDDTSAQIKAELSALAQERARIRQKEAALDEERARLTANAGTTTTGQNESQSAAEPRAELKDLRKQYRNALLEGIDDDEIEAMEEKMEELRLTIYNQANQAVSTQERITNEFNTVYAAVHSEFPFLSVDHPDVNQDLNDDINAYYLGRMQKGESPAIALRAAVNKFAPAYANTLGGDAESTSKNKQADNSRKTAADKLVREKLSKGGFSEVRSVGRAEATKPFTGYTPMEDILKKAS
jgi:hypothetical protein